MFVPIGLGLTCLLTCAACSSDESSTPPPSTAQSAAAIYVGAVDKSEVKVGLVVENGKAALFFCGGPSSLAQTKWLRGAAEPKRVVLSKDGWKGEANLTDGEATGTVDMASGTAVPFKATRVTGGSIAGLYESGADVKEGKAGVVVSAEDAAQGAFVVPNLPVAQIIVITPIRVLDTGIPVKVDGRDMFVKRVVPF